MAPFKLVFGAVSLWYTLIFRLPYFPKAILVQVRLRSIPYPILRPQAKLFFLFYVKTPPALPTLPIVQLVCKLQRSKLIIDWHNTAYSILGMRLGQSSKPTLIAKRCVSLSIVAVAPRNRCSFEEADYTNS